SSRLARWALELQEFDYRVTHRAGLRIPHVDGLSRYLDLEKDELSGEETMPFESSGHMIGAIDSEIFVAGTALGAVVAQKWISAGDRAEQVMTEIERDAGINEVSGLEIQLNSWTKKKIRAEQ